jgi:hypothetical protein
MAPDVSRNHQPLPAEFPSTSILPAFQPRRNARASRATTISLFAAAAALVLLVTAGAARADTILFNGDLSKGTANSPADWQPRGWKHGSEYTIYTWHHEPGAPASLEISSIKPNDAYWEQTVHLEPGWYHFSASMRAEGVPDTAVGVNLSIVEDGIISRQLRGTTGWETLDFYLKAGAHGAEVPFACRLGGFANLNTGKAFCRDLQVTKVTAPPPNAQYTYDLDIILGVPASATPPAATSASWATILVVLWILLALAVLGRRRIAAELRRILDDWGGPGPGPPPPTGGSPPPPSGPAPTGSGPPPDSGARLAPVARASPASGPLAPAGAEPLDEAGESAQFDSLAPAVVAIAVVCVTALAIRRLEGTPHAVHPMAAIAGLKTVVTTTAWAAARLWLMWALSAAVVAGLLLQFDPELELLDAILAGAAGVWAIAWFLGQLLGPIRLFRPVTIWLLLLAGIVQLWRNPPPIRFSAPTAGQKLALLAVFLFSIGMLPLELGSPVAPYMDVLSYPASVQRILSFGVYLPFDNDPYGCWGPRAQTPGLELFYAMFAMGSHVTLGVLAQSALLVPMGALLIFATYRLGTTLAGDIVGGMATLLLFFDTLFRKLTGMRGTATDFVLVALGLAFLLDRRRRRTLMAIGAIILGTAFASHAIDGGLALMVAGFGVLLWLIDGDRERFIVGLEFLGGAALFGLPELAIGLGRALPYPVLPLMQIAGIAAIVHAFTRMPDGAATESRLTSHLADALVALLLASVIYLHATVASSIFEQIMTQFPLLFILAAGGLIIWAVAGNRTLRGSGLAILAIALLVGTGTESLKYIARVSSAGAFQSGIGDISYKVEEYWCPYFLALAAAVPFASLYNHARSQARPIVVLILLALVIYPWYPRFHVDDNFNEHSIADEWGIDYNTAASGYWIGTHDSRWTMNADDFALVDFLRGEQRAGRITTATHILHIAHDAIVWRDFNRYAVFTGIDDDPIVYFIPGSDIGWFAGSRVRRISELREALASHPSYILEQYSPPPWMNTPPDGYDEVFHRDSLQLFRRK